MFSCKFCQIFKSTVPDDCFCSQHQSFIEKYDLIKHPSQIWFFYLRSWIILERIYYLVFEINNLMTVHVLGLKGKRYCKLNFEYYQILILLSWNQILYLFENKNYKFTTFEINVGLSFFFFLLCFRFHFIRILLIILVCCLWCFEIKLDPYSFIHVATLCLIITITLG